MCIDPNSFGLVLSRNILLARQNVVKISDFGLAKYVEYKDYYKNEKSRPLPIKWLSLETLTDGVYTVQSDVWSFGVVLWELFSLGDTPYPGIEPNEIRPRVVMENLRLSMPEHALDCIYDVIRECQFDEPEDRPTFQELEERFAKISADCKSGRLSVSCSSAPPAQPRSAFANSEYFNTSTCGTSQFPESLNLPTSPSSYEGEDGYLLPTPNLSAFTYLQVSPDTEVKRPLILSE